MWVWTRLAGKWEKGKWGMGRVGFGERQGWVWRLGGWGIMIFISRKWSMTKSRVNVGQRRIKDKMGPHIIFQIYTTYMKRVYKCWAPTKALLIYIKLQTYDQLHLNITMWCKYEHFC